MLIDNESGVFRSKAVQWPGGPGLFHVTSVSNSHSVDLERLGSDGVTWVLLSSAFKIAANAVVNFDLDKCTLRADMAAGTDVFADIETRRYSP